MNVAHTPGPWVRESVADREGSLGVFNAKGAPRRIAVVPLRLNKREREANARLIAAAPELLDALKALHTNVDKDLSGFWTESTSNFMQQAEAAIAHAEGR